MIELTPRVIAQLAQLDQQSAAAECALDELLDATRGLLAEDLEPNVVAQILAVQFLVQPKRACTAVGYALVRLAQERAS